MFNDFLLQFVVAFVLELVRKRYFSFSKIVSFSGPAKASQKVVVEDTSSELDLEIEQVKKELAEMKAEAEKVNTPDTYAKYGKLQRQIVQKEKVLALMVKENQEEKTKKAAEMPLNQAPRQQ